MATQVQRDETFISHLIDLRQCLLKVVVVLAIAFVACVFFAKKIYHILAEPLLKVLPQDSHFIATHPFEAWVTYLKTALLSALFVSLPFIFWQLWRFISPGLKRSEKKYSLLFVTLTSIFFMAGAVFGYFYVFPFAFQYFTGLLNETDIVFLPQMKDYLNFTFRLLLAFGLTFELPIILLLLSAFGIVSFSKLVSFQKYMIVLAFLVAAILTPPDVITQILMALPIIILYQLGLLFAWFFKKKNKKVNSNLI